MVVRSLLLEWRHLLLSSQRTSHTSTRSSFLHNFTTLGLTPLRFTQVLAVNKPNQLPIVAVELLQRHL